MKGRQTGSSYLLVYSSNRGIYSNNIFPTDRTGSRPEAGNSIQISPMSSRDATTCTSPEQQGARQREAGAGSRARTEIQALSYSLSTRPNTHPGFTLNRFLNEGVKVNLNQYKYNSLIVFKNINLKFLKSCISHRILNIQDPYFILSHSPTMVSHT